MIKVSFIFSNIKLFSSQWIIFNRKIKIENTSGIVGDEYKKVYVPVRKGNMNFEKYGLITTTFFYNSKAVCYN